MVKIGKTLKYHNRTKQKHNKTAPPEAITSIIPQAFKNVLPTLLNEFITLLKETSIVGYVGIMDLTRAGNIVRGVTFSAFVPLITVAAIYLVIVLILTWLVSKVERRLRRSERKCKGSQKTLR